MLFLNLKDGDRNVVTPPARDEMNRGAGAREKRT